MIILKNITKSYKARFGNRLVLNDISLTINPGEKIGILGRNGAGKSTLLRIIAGTEKSTSGIVQRNMTVSWPMGISGGLQGTLSGIDNVKFICRIYGLEIAEKIKLIEEITELGRYLREPVATVLVSHIESQIKELTRTIYVLNKGSMRKFAYPNNAIAFYHGLINENKMELG